MKKLSIVLLMVAVIVTLTACKKTPAEPSVGNSVATEANTVGTTAVTDASQPTEGISQMPTEHIHDYTGTVTPATCTDDGFTTYNCSCGESYVSNKTAYTGHSFGQWVTVQEPTESATGTAERKCSACNTAESKTLGKLIVNHTHSYTEKVTSAATCAKTGTKTFTCTCGENYTESIAKTDHKYTTTITQATCISAGYSTATCSQCGDSYAFDRTNARGHAYDSEIVKPTCSENGYTKHTCARCKNSYHDTVTNATGHTYTFTSDTATCISNGVKTETCTKCGHKKTSATTASGHTIKTETQEATCRYRGYVKEICKTCGTVVSTVTIPATEDHEWVTYVVSEYAQKRANEGVSGYHQYFAYTDWEVDACKKCNYCSMSGMRFRYTDYEAAMIMLGYVNDLRAEVYGTHDYDLVLDETLMEWSNIRAVEIVDNYSHAGKPLICAENICGGGTGVYEHFLKWKDSPGHYANMIDKENKYFGYAFCNAAAGTSSPLMYGVQLFK